MSELPEPESVKELARKAGATDLRPVGMTDDIDELRAHIRQFCATEEKLHGRSEALSFARTKLDEAMFWLRRHREQRS